MSIHMRPQILASRPLLLACRSRIGIGIRVLREFRRVLGVGKFEQRRQFAASALAIGLLLTGCAEKPVLELQQARETVAMARDFEADIYAPTEFEMAVFNLESGEFDIEAQDQVPFWSRNYELSLEYLALATEQAEQAQSLAEANRADVFERARRALSDAQVAFQAGYEAVESARQLPMTARDRQSFDDELAGIFGSLGQAEGIFGEGNYARALVMLEEVQARALALESRARRMVDFAATSGR